MIEVLLIAAFSIFLVAANQRIGRLKERIRFYEALDAAVDKLHDFSDEPLKFRQGWLEAIDYIGKQEDLTR